MIEQFENHPNKNMLLKDYKKSEEIHCSQESKVFIPEMGNNEIFKFFETSLMPTLANPTLAQIGVTVFWPSFSKKKQNHKMKQKKKHGRTNTLLGPKGWGRILGPEGVGSEGRGPEPPKGGAPKPRKMGVRRVRPGRVGA